MVARPGEKDVIDNGRWSCVGRACQEVSKTWQREVPPVSSVASTTGFPGRKARKFLLASVMAAMMGGGLSACSIPPLQNPKVLNSLVGDTALQIVDRFGVPTGVFQTQGHEFLAYNQTDTTFTDPDPGWGWGWGGWGWGWDSPWGWGWGGPWGYAGPPAPIVTTTSCQTTFELVNDRVMGWKMRGDGC
ncbi:hypothetical protein [Oecophyllibacter saccharovorans]|nr:hypothetical protein [Oecophyllibacter saccharovorans]